MVKELTESLAGLPARTEIAFSSHGASDRDQPDIGGTYCIGEICLIPVRLVERFGPPGKSDGYKVSGRYVFVDDSGRVYVLYDWKSTSLYHGTLRTPEGLWAKKRAIEFHIGGTTACDVAAFKSWLQSEVG